MADVINMKVVGVGGAGNNVVGRMIVNGISGVDYVAINTDKPTLEASGAPERLQIGQKLTHGQGAGSRPEVGRMAAEEDRNNINKLFDGADAVFITAGMGGGTGTGAAPVVAEAAKSAGALTIGVVSTPFRWEGARKMRVAEAGIAALKEQVDTLFVIPNENIRKVSDQSVSFAQAFTVSDDVLNRAVGGIANLLKSTGFINLDFADLKTILRKSGFAHLGLGEASGKGKVEEAAAAAIRSELTETSVHGARRVIVNLISSPDLPMDDVSAVMERIQNAADEDANIIFGLGFDEKLVDALRVIVIATDFADEGASSAERAAAAEEAASVAQKQREAADGGQSGEENWEKWFNQYFAD